MMKVTRFQVISICQPSPCLDTHNPAKSVSALTRKKRNLISSPALQRQTIFSSFITTYTRHTCLHLPRNALTKLWPETAKQREMSERTASNFCSQRKYAVQAGQNMKQRVSLTTAVHLPIRLLHTVFGGLLRRHQQCRAQERWTARYATGETCSQNSSH